MISELASILSRLLNVLTGGVADQTFSARSHQDGLWTEPVIDWVFLHLRDEPFHCRRWYVADLDRARALLRAEQNF